MAEIERTEHRDGGRARAWTLRAVRALHDPAWTADGYVSDRWRPVSPVTGRLDAFQWQTPVAACLPTRAPRSNPRPSRKRCWLRPRRDASRAGGNGLVEPPRDEPSEPVAAPEPKPAEPAPAAAQDNAPPPAAAEPAPPRHQRRHPRRPPNRPRPGRPPCSAPAGHLPKTAPAPVPAVIPIVRAPDDPGIDEDGPRDEFAEQIGPPKAQAGGWRGFLSRWGN